MWPSLEIVFISTNSPPPLRHHCFLQVVSEFDLAQVGPFLLNRYSSLCLLEEGMDTHRPPHFDDTNFPYYSAIMACYLEAVGLGVWRVTRDGMKPPKNPEKLNVSDERNSFKR